MGVPGLVGVAPPERVTQEVEALFRHAADACLVFVDRQLQFLDHLSQRPHGDVGRILAADHQVIGIVDHDGSQPSPRA